MAREYARLRERNQVTLPASVVEQTEGWAATEVEVVGSASHFFVGRTDRLVELAAAYVDRVVSATPSR